MRTLSKYLLAATLAVAFVASADAQGQRRGGGGQPPGGRGQGGGGFGNQFGLTTLMVNKSVLEEIKATDEQKEKLAKWAPEARTKQQEKQRELRGDGGQPDFAKMAEANAAIAKEQLEEVSKVLKEDQVKRVKQIQVQLASVGAFRQKEVQDALKLTDEQKETIREIQMSLGQEMRELGGFGGGGGGGGGRPSPEAMAERTKKVNELNKKFLDKVVAQLKDDQKKTWEELNGKAFEFKPEPPRRRDN